MCSNTGFATVRQGEAAVAGVQQTANRLKIRKPRSRPTLPVKVLAPKRFLLA
jgi:hypothetical protein